MQTSHNPFRRHRQRVTAASLAVMVLVALGACSPTETETEQEPGDDTPPDTEAASDAPTTLTIPLQRQPSTFDPIDLAEGADAYIWASVYDTLVAVGPDGEYVPRAAEEWSFSDDGLELTVTLRDGLEFSDGTAVTAEDLKATIEYVRDTPGPGQEQVALISEIEVTDDRTAVLRLSGPEPNLLRNLAGRAGIIAKADEMTEDGYGLNPIGSGPYVLDLDRTSVGSTYVIQKREDHWDAANYQFDTVTMRVIEDPVAIENALRSGEVDIAPVQPHSQEGLEGAGVAITEVEASTNSYIKILDREGTIEPALADVRVRQALNMAFDRESIVESAMQGVGRPSHQVFYPNDPVYLEELDSLYPYDPEGARELLAEAGYPDGFSVSMPSVVYSATLEPVVTQALADIGVTVSWTPVPPSDTVTAITSASYPLVVWFGGNDPAAKVADGHYSFDGFLNPLGNQDPELTALLEEAQSSADEDTANELYRQVNSWVVENAWDVPIAFGNQLYGVRDGYAFVGTEYQVYSTLAHFDVE